MTFITTMSPQFKGVTPILEVSDLVRALDWYRDVLGFEVGWQWGDPPRLASVCRGKVELNLARPEPARPIGPSRMYISVQGVDALYAQLAAARVAFTATLGDRDYGMRDFGLKDLDGNEMHFGEAMHQP